MQIVLIHQTFIRFWSLVILTLFVLEQVSLFIIENFKFNCKYNMIELKSKIDYFRSIKILSNTEENFELRYLITLETFPM